MSRLATQDEVEALFLTAGLPAQRVYGLPNGYWPDGPRYDDVRTPWWLVVTAIGLIQVGWRKKVMHIAWDTTPIRTIVTNDDVTKTETYVHAWTNDRAVAYLMTLKHRHEQMHVEIDPALERDFEIPNDLIDEAVRKIEQTYPELTEGNTARDWRRSKMGDAIRQAVRATLYRASRAVPDPVKETTA